jgi:hypothetical protein
MPSGSARHDAVQTKPECVSSSQKKGALSRAPHRTGAWPSRHLAYQAGSLARGRRTETAQTTGVAGCGNRDACDTRAATAHSRRNGPAEWATPRSTQTRTATPLKQHRQGDSPLSRPRRRGRLRPGRLRRRRRGDSGTRVEPTPPSSADDRRAGSFRSSTRADKSRPSASIPTRINSRA